MNDDADDDIDAGGGDDQVDAGGGADVIDAGEGNDVIYLEADAIWSSGYKAGRVEWLDDGSYNIAEKISLDGKNRFLDIIDGNADYDTVYLTDDIRGDAFFLHDFFSDFRLDFTRFGDSRRTPKAKLYLLKCHNCECWIALMMPAFKAAL